LSDGHCILLRFIRYVHIRIVSARNGRAMSVNGLGIPMIEPSIAITPRSPTRASRRERDRDGAEAAVATDAVVRQAPPSPGTGKNVDKSA